ncbi:MAG: hypothetical protein SVX38_03715, partial [Chloroflexota bacterium]|nr:hypothetical protein [Chloroflexota bacterium]
ALPISQRLEEKVSEALSGAGTGEFTITATDEEVTSLIVAQMEKASDTPMRDVQVHFDDGRIYVWATLADVMPFDVSVYLVFTATVMDDQLQVDIVESSAGVIPLPQNVLDSLSQTVNETIAEAEVRTPQKVRITEVTVGDGEITVSGELSSPATE